VGPEDAITITVLRHPELSGDFAIPPDGMVTLPEAGQVAMTGKTLPEIGAEVSKRLTATLRNPQVTVTLRAPRQQRIYAIGAVANPGIFTMAPGWRITEALAAAGGIQGELADCSAALLRAAGGEQQAVDLAGVLAGAQEANLALEPGDVLIITAAERLPIFVMGGVKSPGMYEIRAGLGAVEALALAGGLAAPEEEATVTVMRGGQQAGKLDLGAVKRGEQLINIPLQRGDVVSVQGAEQLPIYVMGEVKSPGLYDIPAGLGALEALTRAGGLTVPEEEAIVAVLRNGEQLGTLDLGAVKQGRPLVNIPLQKGDMLKVDKIETTDIMIAGQVKAPGQYKIKKDDGVMQALTMAGGPLPDAMLSRVTVLRKDGGSETINLSPSFLTGAAAPEVELASGDLIMVPETTARIAVLGYVNQPGYYTLPDAKTLTLSEAVATAGGMDRTRSGLTMVAVLRADGDKQSRKIYNLQKFLKDGDAANNPAIMAGDVVYVPETNRVNWDVVFRSLSLTSIIYNLADKL